MNTIENYTRNEQRKLEYTYLFVIFGLHSLQILLFIWSFIYSFMILAVIVFCKYMRLCVSAYSTFPLGVLLQPRLKGQR